VVDRDKRIIFFNQKAESLVGYKAEEVLSKRCVDGIHCEKCTGYCELFDKGEIVNTEVTLLARDGKIRVCRKNAYVLRDKDGVITGGVEFLHDITEWTQKVQEAEMQRRQLLRRQQLQTAILSSICEGVITLDPARRVTSISNRATEITGWSASEALGRTCGEVLGADCSDDCPVAGCMAGKSEAGRLTTLSRRDKESYPAFSLAKTLRDESGQPIGHVLVIEDRCGADAPVALGDGIVGSSTLMQGVYRLLQQVANSDVTVLITGESGTGKEVVARALHKMSLPEGAPFVAVNCAAIPENLLESELFGHVRGAFTGAVRDNPGRVREAEGGILFLDEIGDMPMSLQVKLLRFLQEREFQRVGDVATRKSNARVVAATNADLPSRVERGQFREDLYYRIKVVPIHVPPLRARREDIAPLATHILKGIAARLNRPELTLTPNCLERLLLHDWPGNVRELMNVLEYATTVCTAHRIRTIDLPPDLEDKVPQRYRGHYELPPGIESERIRSALEVSSGNRSAAARLVGMNRVTLYRKMKRYGLA